MPYDREEKDKQNYEFVANDLSVTVFCNVRKL